MKYFVLLALVVLFVAANKEVKTDRLRIDRGTNSVPTIAFTPDKDTGIYSQGSGFLNISTNGVERASFGTSVNTSKNRHHFPSGTSGNPSLGFTDDTDNDTGIFRSGEDMLAVTTDGSTRLIVQNGSIAPQVDVVPASGVQVLAKQTAGESGVFPGYSFDGDDDTGFQRYAIDSVGVVIGGTRRFFITEESSESVAGVARSANPTFRLSSNTTTGVGTLRFQDSLITGGDIEYSHTTDTMEFNIGGSARARFSSGNFVELFVFSGPSLNDLCANSAGTGMKQLQTCASSERFKKDIKDMSDKYVVENFRPVEYTWKHNDKPDIGFIAEEVYKTAPELANYDEKNDQVIGVNYRHMVSISFAELQRLKKREKLQDQEIELLKKRLDALENR